MTHRGMDRLSVILDALTSKVGHERFGLWFQAVRWVLGERRLELHVESHFLNDWLRKNFAAEIQEVADAHMGVGTEIVISVDPTRSAHNPRLPAAKNGHALQNGNSAAEEPRPEGPPVPSRRARAFASLETFIVGPSNRLGYTAAKMVLERPGAVSPVLIHGPVAVGKTHLLEGIWSAAKRQHPRSYILYLSAEQFTTEFVESVKGGLPSFRRKYRGVDMLLVDDVQFFAGKRATAEEFLHTINTLAANGKQVVLAADRGPNELAELGPGFVARVSGGLVCAVEPAEYETRLQIVAQLAKRIGLSVPTDVQEFVADRLTSHARELSGAVFRLQAASMATQRPVTLELAERSLSELIRHSCKAIRLPDIEKAVCEVFGLDADALNSQRRTKSITNPRMLAMWLARKYTRAAFSEIGTYFGRRSHSTVISAQKQVEQWMHAQSPVHTRQGTYRIDELVRQVERKLEVG